MSSTGPQRHTFLQAVALSDLYWLAGAGGAGVFQQLSSVLEFTRLATHELYPAHTFDRGWR
jgi:hypothetical protein